MVELEDRGEIARRRARDAEEQAAADIWDPPVGPNIFQILGQSIRDCFR